MIFDLFLILIGLALLYFGGDLLISGCLRIAQRYKVSPFIIGATIMGFGTSAPELAVSLLASLQGSPEVAVGNVVGSNIANVSLVLGLTALLTPLTISRGRFNLEAPPLLIVTGMLVYFAWDFNLVRWEGGVMIVGLGFLIWRALQDKEESLIEFEDELKLFRDKPIAFQFGLCVFGLGLLVLGAQWMVEGSVNIARSMGISEWFIGISIIAVGTSLPEIVSSLMSARRGHGEMALGNVFGSNIFNILMVLGATASISPLQIKEPIHPDLLFTTGFTCLLLVLIKLEHKLRKRDGIILLTGYLGYITSKALNIF